MFESQKADSIPSKAVIAELGQMGREFGLSYNVHLPTDIFISDRNSERQKIALETMARTIDRVNPLDPSALILHLPYCEKSFSDPDVRNWQNRVFQNLSKLISAVQSNKIIAIETLEYPLEMLENIILELDLSICLDLGHLMVYDHDVLDVFEQYNSRTSVLHLHGVENGHDHLALERLSDKLFEPALVILNKFIGVVSLEVFSFENLVASLKYLECHWKKN